MESDRGSEWTRTEDLFHRALEQPEESRTAFLASACGADASLRARVDELLAGHARLTAGFLEPPAARGLEGRRVGEFTLVRLIGAGGMGAVYEALQDRPRRTVALKLVRGLFGANRDARRIEREAELMGRLRHENVAHIHAAGTIDDEGGELAWFAMELVPDARTLIAYAREKSLDLDARLDLFERVCRGVQHGHQRGVLHCDLKPDNILVDASGAPKVIDFGIARATGTELSTATLRVGAGEIAGTLAYMSPEQCGGGERETDTRSDVYSLGAVLYELLVDERPLPLAGRSVTESIEIIRTGAPPRPSSRRGDLPEEVDTIVLKALAKDPEDRYASVSELAEDLRRFRRHEPIAARAPTLAKRARLFARRHRTLVLSSAAILGALLAGTAVSVAYAVRATRSAASETRARVHAERIAALHARLFESARPVRALGRAVTVRELLDDARFAAERDAAEDPGVLSDFLGTLGATYSDLGELEQAETTLTRALELAREDAQPARRARLRADLAKVALLRGDYAHAESLLHEALAETPPSDATAGVTARVRLAELLRRTGRASEAQAALEQALALCQPEGRVDGDVLALLFAQIGNVAYQERDFARAESFHARALAIQESSLPADHPATAATRNSLAGDLFDLGRIEEAEALWTRALATFETILDPDHPDLASVVGNLALVYERRRDFDRSAAMFERAIELRRKALGEDHPLLADSLSRYAGMLGVRGDVARSVEVLAEAIAVRRRALARAGGPPEDAGLAKDLFALALAQRRGRRLAEAEATLREVLRIQRDVLAPGHADLGQTLTLLGSVLVDAARPADGEPFLREALEIRRAKLPGNWLTANTQSVLGGCLAALGRVEEAEPLLVDSQAALEKALGPEDYRVKEAAARLRELRERVPPR